MCGNSNHTALQPLFFMRLKVPIYSLFRVSLQKSTITPKTAQNAP